MKHWHRCERWYRQDLPCPFGGVSHEGFVIPPEDDGPDDGPTWWLPPVPARQIQELKRRIQEKLTETVKDALKEKVEQFLQDILEEKTPAPAPEKEPVEARAPERQTRQQDIKLPDRPVLIKKEWAELLKPMEPERGDPDIGLTYRRVAEILLKEVEDAIWEDYLDFGDPTGTRPPAQPRTAQGRDYGPGFLERRPGDPVEGFTRDPREDFEFDVVERERISGGEKLAAHTLRDLVPPEPFRPAELPGFEFETSLFPRPWRTAQAPTGPRPVRSPTSMPRGGGGGGWFVNYQKQLQGLIRGTR